MPLVVDDAIVMRLLTTRLKTAEGGAADLAVLGLGEAFGEATAGKIVAQATGLRIVRRPRRANEGDEAHADVELTIEVLVPETTTNVYAPGTAGAQVAAAFEQAGLIDADSGNRVEVESIETAYATDRVDEVTIRYASLIVRALASRVSGSGLADFVS